METEIKGETQKEKERAVGRSGTSDRKIGRGFGGCGNVPKVHLQNTSSEEPATYAGRHVAAKKQNKKGLWSPTLEEAFRDAVAMYPPCGHKKIISRDAKVRVLALSQFSSMATEEEGLWSRNVEEAFNDAVDLFPPCGNKKIIWEEGKMCGKSK